MDGAKQLMEMVVSLFVKAVWHEVFNLEKIANAGIEREYIGRCIPNLLDLLRRGDEDFIAGRRRHLVDAGFELAMV